MELAELLNQINPAPIYEHFQRGIYSLNVQISPDKSLRLKLDLPRKDLFSQAEINYFQSNPRELAVLLSLCHLIRKVPEEFSRSVRVVYITDLNQSEKLNKAEVVFDAVKSERNTKSHNGKSNQTVPVGWTSTKIKNPPSPENLEIWNNILASLEELIVARKVKFSSLGANHTFLSDLSGGKYRAVGRCIVTEKSGNQIAYEFECVARVNKYEASILSAKFHTQDN